MTTKTLLSICLFAIPTSAIANVIGYRIEGAFDTGNLAGRNYVELFSFDDSSKPNVLSSSPWSTELLSYSLDVESVGKHFTIADWAIERTFSQWIDGSGFLNTRAYLATPGPPGDPPAFSEFLDDGAPHSRSNDVKWYDWSVWNTVFTDSGDNDPAVIIQSVPEGGPGWIAVGVVLLLAGIKRTIS